MIKYVSVAEMQAIEREADASGLSYAQMMENAGSGLAEVVLEECGYLETEGALALVGSGNNGGDALVALAYLAAEGWKTSAVLFRPRPADDPLVARFLAGGGALYRFDQNDLQPVAGQTEALDLEGLIAGHGVLLDGVLGTGARLPLKPDLAAALGRARQAVAAAEIPPVVIAVDCPSGMDCDSGTAAAECIPAEITVTMAAVKHGLYKFPASQLAGDLQVVGIGLPEDGAVLAAWQAAPCFIPDEDWVSSVLPPRPANAHKGTFGTALVIAGSLNYTGAAWLAGQAAYRSGAGLVTLGVPAPLHAALAGSFPEATWLLLAHEGGAVAEAAAETVLHNLGRATALLVGPGFGLEPASQRFIEDLLIEGAGRLPPAVFDADGLKLLAGLRGWPQRLPPLTVLTPHPGEMAILTGLPLAEIQAERLETARLYSREWGHVVVLKGAFSIIAAPDGRAAVIPVATPALACAGTGDVLAGLAVGLRAQGMPAFEAATAAAWIHARAGLLAAENLGSSAAVLAGDLLPAAMQVLSGLVK